MFSAEEWNAIRARRALLREQTTLLGPRLGWLADPTRIPAHAIDASVPPHDVQLAAFSLAAWMLLEMVQSADQFYQALEWEQAFERFHVAPELQTSVIRSVLCPAARHAPGLFAIAEIIAVIPKVASRDGVPPDGWCEIARRSEAFGAMLAHDGTAVQVLMRSYLSGWDEHADASALRILDPSKLKLDPVTGITTVTPIEDLLHASRAATARHNDSYHATCVALQAPAPEGARRPVGTTSMFDAVWSSFADAASRLVFPRFHLEHDTARPAAEPDLICTETLDRLAANRRADLAEAAFQAYPPAVERILGNLLDAAQATSVSAPLRSAR